MKTLSDLQINDIVTRYLAGIPMQLKVSKIDLLFIYCGPYKFDIHNGAEIDEDLEWTRERSGSYIRI